MADDIDIEEHDVLDNPRIKNIFPDITCIKTEVIEYEEENQDFDDGEYLIENDVIPDQIGYEDDESINPCLASEPCDDPLSPPVSSGKSSKARCSVAPTPSYGSSGTTEKTSRNYSGGNPVCPRETPKWQKPITNFFITNTKPDDDTVQAGTSKAKSKKNVIESDEEEVEETAEEPKEEPVEKPINKELDETIELEPLTGEECHKIEEYYPKGDKKKGVGKKSNKENIEVKRKSVKRDLEQVVFGEESENASKKRKV